MGTPAGLLAQVTPRQQEILRLLAEGQNTHEIAEQLHISDITVRNHVEKLLHNLRVHSRLEAVSLAHKAKLL
jgi:DNA-binding NarL/FixJ family response regulator